MPSSIRLRVAEASHSDVGLGRARIDARTRLALGIDAGDVVEIVGKKVSSAKAFRAGPDDEGMGLIRVDGLVRRNLGVGVGDEISARKAEVLAAKRLDVAPIISEYHRISFGPGIEDYVKRGLLTRPIAKGDFLIVSGMTLMGGPLPFMAVTVKPKGIVQVVDETFVVLSERMRRSEVFSSGEQFGEFVDALKGRIDSTLREYAEDIGTMTGVTGERARQLSEALRRFVDGLNAGGTDGREVEGLLKSINKELLKPTIIMFYEERGILDIVQLHRACGGDLFTLKEALEELKAEGRIPS